MSKEKVVVFLMFLLVFSLFIQFVDSTSLDELESGLGSVEEKLDRYSGKSYWSEKWDYLGTRWKEIILRDKFVSSLDNFFLKISIVFFIIFGIHYQISFVFFGVVFLWFFFFFIFDNFLKNFIPKPSSSIISALVVIAFSHLEVFLSIMILIGRAIFTPLSYLARIILLLVFIFIFSFIKYFSNFVSRYIKFKKEKNEKEIAKLEKNIIGKFIKGFMDYAED